MALEFKGDVVAALASSVTLPRMVRVRQLENAGLLEEGTAAGHGGRDLGRNVIVSEVDAVFFARAVQISGVMQDIGGYQQKVALPQVINVVLDHKPAASSVDIVDLKERMTVVRGHDKAFLPQEGFHKDPAETVVFKFFFFLRW